MRIALFSSTIDRTNGYGNITYEYCRALAKTGTDFTLFLPQTEKDVMSSYGLPFRVEWILPDYVFRIFEKSGWRYFRSVDVSSYDLVHSLFAYPYALIAARSAKKHCKPFLMGAQGTYGVLPLTRFPEKLLLKRCYRLAKSIIVPSEYTRKQIIAHAGETYDIDVIHNGVDAERFIYTSEPNPVSSRFTGKRILLTVGGLKERKGQDLVIRALPAIVAEHPDVLYVLVGEGNRQQEYEQLAREHDVQEHVLFVGNKQGDDLVAHFHTASVYVHTPKVVNLNFEGFGIVYLEAGACGVPSVATDAGGIRDAVLDGETGLVVPDGDVPAIADACNRLLADEALRTRLGSAAKAYAEQHDWRYIVQRYLDCYRQHV